MKWLVKFGVLFFTALLAGTPLVGCMLPGGAATDEESACCREMGSECNHGGMPSSHSCCQTVSAPDQAALAKAAFKLSINLVYLGPPTLDKNQALPEIVREAVSFGHSPPEPPPAALDILRI